MFIPPSTILPGYDPHSSFYNPSCIQCSFLLLQSFLDMILIPPSTILPVYNVHSILLLQSFLDMILIPPSTILPVYNVHSSFYNPSWI
ncbi:hypothetical protein CDAR_504741 [Caerostris darwini]|uniref:Uncharacterized protein n=1 Tax=Caerostris darwini TaxID=1538125 RepID=A0AAV4QTR2_9ARAC|nr:hypothetical protein CDAR_504741 [Caerostris darwini]